MSLTQVHAVLQSHVLRLCALSKQAVHQCCPAHIKIGQLYVRKRSVEMVSQSGNAYVKVKVQFLALSAGDSRSAEVLWSLWPLFMALKWWSSTWVRHKYLVNASVQSRSLNSTVWSFTLLDSVSKTHKLSDEILFAFFFCPEVFISIDLRFVSTFRRYFYNIIIRNT